MSIANIITIIVVMGGIICSLIAVIYKLLSDRIKINSVKITVIEKAYNKVSTSIPAINTNIEWIKKKLNDL